MLDEHLRGPLEAVLCAEVQRRLPILVLQVGVNARRQQTAQHLVVALEARPVGGAAPLLKVVVVKRVITALAGKW